MTDSTKTDGTAHNAEADASIAALQSQPFSLHLPLEWKLPFIFASPHSGRDYLAGFVAASRLSPLGLRRSEDAFVDELFAGAVTAGAPLIAARFPRAFVDVNRSSRELDPGMFDGPLRMPVEGFGSRVAAGLGVIPRIVRDGAEIYRQKLAPAEAAARITEFYEPYHTALGGLVAETTARFGFAFLIDCHSMPSASNVPDVVIGDRFGVAATPGLTRRAEQAFANQGFSVGRNAPYAGGFTTQRHGRRNGPVQALQVEINRALYLDEERIKRLSDFAAVAARISAAIGELASFSVSKLARPDFPALAAE